VYSSHLPSGEIAKPMLRFLGGRTLTQAPTLAEPRASINPFHT
jgi:hypothetical protein